MIHEILNSKLKFIEEILENRSLSMQEKHAALQSFTKEGLLHDFSAESNPLIGGSVYQAFNKAIKEICSDFITDKESKEPDFYKFKKEFFLTFYPHVTVNLENFKKDTIVNPDSFYQSHSKVPDFIGKSIKTTNKELINYILILSSVLLDAYLAKNTKLNNWCRILGVRVLEHIRKQKVESITSEDYTGAACLGHAFLTIGSVAFPHLYIFDKENPRIPNSPFMLKFTDDFYKKLSSFAVVSYKSFPALIPPTDWNEKGYEGGTHHPQENSFLAKGKPQVNLKVTSSNNYVVSNVNALQKVKWRVNTPLVEILERFSKSDFDKPFADAFGTEAELESLVAADSVLSGEEKVLYEKQCNELKELKFKIETTPFLAYRKYKRTKIGLGFYYLALLKLFSKVPYFYFIHRLDGRGRIYPSGGLTYQGNELVRACLEFGSAKKVYITDENIGLLISYGLSLYGKGADYSSPVDFINKTSCKWLEDFDFEFISKAKKPLLFLAFCLEYKKWNAIKEKQNAYTVLTNFPIFIDASCNALQHYSCLGGIDKFLPFLNMVESKEKKDFYSFIIEKIKPGILSSLQQLIEKERPESKKKKILEFVLNNQDIFISRKFLKTPIMSFGYGVSVSGVCEQIYENLKKDPKLDPLAQKIFNSKQLFALGYIVHNSVSKELSSFNATRKFFNKLIRIHFVHTQGSKIPFVWALPSGIKIESFYPKTKSVHYKFRAKIMGPNGVYNTVRTFSYMETLDEVDLYQMFQSFSPNFVHSLDALNLHLFLKAYFKGRRPRIAAIHDSIGLTVDDIKEAKLLFKEAFVDLYKHKIDNIVKEMIVKNTPKSKHEELVNEYSKLTKKRKDFAWGALLNNPFFITF